MSVEIINIGTELLLGQVVNTNAAFLSQRLAMIGQEVAFQVTVGDNEVRLTVTLNQALGRSNIIIITGGLGPTEDDITKKILGKVLGQELILDKECLEKIKAYFLEKKITPPPANFNQALVFKRAVIIPNRLGTAQGQIIEDKGVTVIILPGVPREMKAMFDEVVIPYLRAKFPSGSVIKSKFLKIFGLGESAMEDLIRDIIVSSMNPELGTICSEKELILRLTAKADDLDTAQRLIRTVEARVRERLGTYIFGQDEETMEIVVGSLLTLKHKTIALAESCTGGTAADLLTNVAGSSAYFDRGIVCYSNRAKIELLKIPESLIKRNGAVSPEVCEAMAKNVRNLSGSSLGLSITGIAGPGGATPDKPIGLAFIGLADEKETVVKKYNFSGQRRVIKDKTAQTALDMIRRYLLDEKL